MLLRLEKGVSRDIAAGETGTPMATATLSSRAQSAVVEPAFRMALGPLALAGALLGPNLDNYHSAFGVLTYKNPVQLSVAGHVLVTTDWW